MYTAYGARAPTPTNSMSSSKKISFSLSGQSFLSLSLSSSCRRPRALRTYRHATRIIYLPSPYLPRGKLIFQSARAHAVQKRARGFGGGNLPNYAMKTWASVGMRLQWRKFLCDIECAGERRRRGRRRRRALSLSASLSQLSDESRARSRANAYPPYLCGEGMCLSFPPSPDCGPSFFGQ